MSFKFPDIRVSRIFFLSLSLLIFLIIIVSTIFSSFVYNNSRIQLIESLYLQAQSINKILPSLNAENIDFDLIADSLAVEDTRTNKLRITLIDSNWNVIGDSQVNKMDLSLVEKHSPDNRIEIYNALSNDFGSATRNSETINRELIYVAIMRDKNDPNQGIIRLSLPFDIYSSFFNFFVYPFAIIVVLVIASSVFISLNVENTFRNDLTILFKNTQRALKGKKFKVSNSTDTQVKSISNVIEEISQRLSNEIEQTLEQRTKFGSVLDSINQGIIIFNKNFRVKFANDIALEMFGKHQFFLGEKITSKKLSVLNKTIKEAKKTSNAEREFSINIKNKEMHFLLSASRMDSTDELILLINDISSLKKLENRRKNLISDISHEIKTPISVIRAGSETLRDGAIHDPKVAEKFLHSINSNSERLAEMIDDLLELEKIEVGQIFLKNEKIKLKEEIDLIIESLSTLIDEKKLTVENKVSPNYKFKSDKQSLRDILINLLNNAVKYSKEHGRVILSSRVSKDFLILEIKDFGYGIEKANIKRIFDRFYRTAKARANTKGTGLGLTLVNQLVKRIGGEISVESTIGKGSTFFIKFPFKTVK
jgi:two-component system phosphate regulon sensor histidine kinase PhoR